MAPFDIETYLQKISEELRRTFGQKLLYIGLQGSFGRGEATDQSDIDVVVILEELTLDAERCSTGTDLRFVSWYRKPQIMLAG